MDGSVGWDRKICAISGGTVFNSQKTMEDSDYNPEEEIEVSYICVIMDKFTVDHWCICTHAYTN